MLRAARLLIRLPKTSLTAFYRPINFTPIRLHSSIRIKDKQYRSDEHLGDAFERVIADTEKNAKRSFPPVHQDGKRYWPNELLVFFHDIARKILLGNVESTPSSSGKYTEEDVKQAVKKAVDDYANKEKKTDFKYTEEDMKQVKEKIKEEAQKLAETLKSHAFASGFKVGKEQKVKEQSEQDLKKAKAAKEQAFDDGLKAGNKQREQLESNLKYAATAGEEKGKQAVIKQIEDDLTRSIRAGFFTSDYKGIEKRLRQFTNHVTREMTEDSFAKGFKKSQEEKEQAVDELKKDEKFLDNLFSITREDIYKKLNNIPLTVFQYKIRRGDVTSKDRIRIKDSVMDHLVAKNWLFQWTVEIDEPIDSNHLFTSARKKLLLHLVYIAALIVAYEAYDKWSYGETLSQYIDRKNRQKACDKLRSIPAETNLFKKCDADCKAQTEKQMQRKHTMQARRENRHGDLLWFNPEENFEDKVVQEAVGKALATYSQETVAKRAAELQARHYRK